MNSPSFIFAENNREIRTDEVPFVKIVDMKDAGINYQRVNVGLADKGNSDLSARLLYEGSKLHELDEEYWKGSDIESYYIAKKTSRYVRQNIKLKSNERVILNKEYFKIKPKLIWRQTASYPIAAFDNRGIWFGRSIQAGIIKHDQIDKFDYKYLLALLNSKYIRFLYSETVKESGRVFPQVKLEKISNLPIKVISLSEQQKYIQKVSEILDITKSGDYSSNNEMKTKVSIITEKIDNMVYKLSLIHI